MRAVDREASSRDDPARVEASKPGRRLGSWTTWLCAAALVAVWAASARGVVQPLVYADEAGYVLNARNLAQLGGPSGTFYYPGYSVVLVPALWASDDFDVVWRLIQVVNLALLLSAFMLLRSVLARLAPWSGATARTVVAAVACLYPAWMNNASLAVSENLLVPAVLGVWLLLLRSEEDRSNTIAAFLAGVAAGAISVVHPRAVVVTIAVFLALLGAVIVRSWSARRGGVVGIGLLVGLALSRVVVSVAEIASDNTGSVVDNLTSVEGLRQVLIALDGHMLYLLVATGGMLAVGILQLASLRTSFAVTRAAILLSLAGSWVLSAAFMAGGTGDKLIYGRYNEPFFVIAFAIGLSWVSSNGLRVRVAATVAVIMFVLAGAFAWATEHSDVAASVNRTNVFGILPLLRRSVPAVDWRALLFVGLVALVVIVAMSAHRRTRSLVLLAVGVTFVWVGAMNADVLGSDAEARALQGSLVGTIVQAESGTPDCVTLDRRGLSQWHRYNYQVLLPRTTFNQVTSLDDPSVAACGPFILSSVPEAGSEVPGARLAGLETHAGVALWVTDGDVQSSLEAAGALFPEDGPTNLPSESRVGSIALIGPDVTLEDLRSGAALHLRVRHEGSGSPWAGQSGLGGWDAGPVRVVTTVTSSDGTILVGPVRSEIPATVAPGESFDVMVELPPTSVDGDAHLEIELVSEGHAWFGDHGSLDLDVAG
jgi:hypothetical protein